MTRNAALSPPRPHTVNRKESRLWLIERITAILLIPLSLWLAPSLAALPDTSHEAFLDWIRQPPHYLSLLAFLLISVPHALLGLGSILDDYVQGPRLKRYSLAAVKLTLLGVLATSGAALFLLIQTS